MSAMLAKGVQKKRAEESDKHQITIPNMNTSEKVKRAQTTATFTQTNKTNKRNEVLPRIVRGQVSEH